MKFSVTMKTPDVLDYAMKNARQDLLESRGLNDEDYPTIEDLPEVDYIAVSELYDTMKNTAEKWIRHGEYVTLEFDTETGACIVLPAKK